MMRLRCVDLETTGIDPVEHGVCEIGWTDTMKGRIGPARPIEIDAEDER